MDMTTYGKIMEQLGGIQSGINALDEKLDTANESMCKRLDKIEKRTDARFEKVEDRVTTLEQKPGKRWEIAVGAVITLGVGYILGALFK